MVAIVAAVLGYGISFQFDLFERLAAAAANYERYQIDEIVIGLLAAGAGSTVLLFRRWRDLGAALSQLSVSQRELVAAKESLEERVEERTAQIGRLAALLQELLTEQNEANARLRREIAVRKRLESEILSIHEREQQRIGRDLHDGLGQLLTGVACLSVVLVDKLERGEPSVDDARQVRDLSEQSLAVTRDLSRDLYLGDLERDGLFAALAGLAESTSLLLRIECATEIEAGSPEPQGERAMQLYRIAQEAITNAAKHGAATRIRVRLGRMDGRLTLSVEDNGRGFDPGTPPAQGMGLSIMRYRASAISAELEVQNRDSGGVMVRCRLPARERISSWSETGNGASS